MKVNILTLWIFTFVLGVICERLSAPYEFKLIYLLIDSAYRNGELEAIEIIDSSKLKGLEGVEYMQAIFYEVHGESLDEDAKKYAHLITSSNIDEVVNQIKKLRVNDALNKKALYGSSFSNKNFAELLKQIYTNINELELSDPKELKNLLNDAKSCYDEIEKQRYTTMKHYYLTNDYAQFSIFPDDENYKFVIKDSDGNVKEIEPSEINKASRKLGKKTGGRMDGAHYKIILGARETSKAITKNPKFCSV